MNKYKKIVSLCFVSVLLLSLTFQSLDHAFIAYEPAQNNIVSTSTFAAQEASPFIINLTSPTNYVRLTQAALNDSSVMKNVCFKQSENKTVWIRLPKYSHVIDARLNLSGFTRDVTKLVLEAIFMALPSGHFHGSPAVADVDADGTLEIIGGGGKDNVYVFNHTGHKLQVESYYYTDASYSASPVVSDVDGDGSLEIIIGDWDVNLFVFGTQGKSPMWEMFHYDLNHTGYLTESGTKVYPNSPYLDVGSDGDLEWSYSGEFDESVSPARISGFSQEINDYLSIATPDENGSCNIPLTLHSDTAGKIQISDISISYDYDMSYLYNVSYVLPDIGYNINATANRASVNVSYSGFYVHDDATMATVDGNEYPIKTYNGHKYVEYNETISKGSYWSNYTIWWDTLKSPIEIVEVTPCDQHGNPKDNFTKGSLAYFKVTVNNTFLQPIGVLITVNAYDADGATIGVPSIKGPISRGILTYILGLPITASAQLGNATVYANAFTDWPHLGGVPYCPEKSATFQIVEEV